MRKHWKFKNEREKELLEIVRELDELNKIKREAPIIKLDTPYQRGWYRNFVVREDATRRRDAAAFYDALKYVNNVRVSPDTRNKFTNFPQGFHFRHVPQALGIIAANDFEGLKLSPLTAKLFQFCSFHWPTDKRPIWNNNFHGCRTHGYYEIRPQFDMYFVFNIFPRMITHSRTVYPEVESKRAFLHRRIEQFGGWNKYNRLKRGSAQTRIEQSWMRPSQDHRVVPEIVVDE